MGGVRVRAKLWQALDRQRVQCQLCCHQCVLLPGKQGLCGVRYNRQGELMTLVGDMVASVNMDPVEKKPLYHYRPGSKTYSLGTVGCNLSCAFCQNHAISRSPVDEGTVTGKRVTPELLVHEAQRHGAGSVSFTYNEPTVFFELMYETAGIALSRGLDTVMVSNGFQSESCLAALYPRIRAANIDLKSFREDFYQKRCKARLAPVLDNLKTMVQAGWWVEVTTLVIPGCNDSDEELRDIARFIRQELGPDVPWHISRFHGAYRMLQHPDTPVELLHKAWRIGRNEGLHYVYTGNVSGGPTTATYCPQCNAACVRRAGFTSEVLLKGKACPQCGAVIAGVWE